MPSERNNVGSSDLVALYGVRYYGASRWSGGTNRKLRDSHWRGALAGRHSGLSGVLGLPRSRQALNSPPSR
jgi:hypothetical protein